MPSSMPRINWLEIQGFRAFGKELQRVDFSSQISVLWGPNSQGKTSFAEAIEFLFSGSIVRKELLASAQDEFADSLRNTHLPSTKTVYIAAEVLDSDGTPHSIRRTLASDFSKRANCTSTLEIDGKPATADDFAKIGIALSQPPMAVPILMQHTLGYLFTAKPLERSLYFKALLEVGDLDLLRNAIGQRETSLSMADTNLIKKLKSAAAIDNQDVKDSLAPLLVLDESPLHVAQAIAYALDALIWSAGFATPLDTATKIGVVEGELQQKQTKTFPLAQLNRGTFVTVTIADDELWPSLDNFGEQSQKVDTEVKDLTNLFTEVLRVPAVAANTSAIDCPVCGTEDALTEHRVQVIRDKLKTSQAYVEAQASVQSSLRQLDTKLTTLEGNIRGARPSFQGLKSKQRKDTSFSVERMRELLPEEQQEQLQTWLRELRSYLRAMRQLAKLAAAIKTTAKQETGTFANAEAVQGLRTSLAGLKAQQARSTQVEKAFVAAEQALKDTLRAVVDAKSNTTGWQELLDIAKDQDGLLSDVIDMKARAVVKGELTKALQKIDRAKEEVMNDKFAGMSQEIQDWWERLRPDEPVFFSGVKPRPQTVRTIDFKVSLATTSERLNPHVRDVIAIFSMSQMHCLGLAAFLARSVREKCGFVVLDDPILSSDEDHRTSFLHIALDALLKAGFQVILLTQDQGIQKDLTSLYAHLSIDQFQIILAEPANGAEITKTADSVSAMLAKVKPYIGNARLEARMFAAEKSRNIAERVCKEIVVNNRRLSGEPTAAITDYTGAKGTLESLITEVERYLIDLSHPGKLRVIARTLNPGCHDDNVPTKEALKQAYGELVGFRKQYSLT
jgi:AAA domain